MSISFIAGGDIALNRKSPCRAFGGLIGQLQKSDLTFVNLEAPLSARGKAEKGKILLRGRPEMARALTEANIHAVSFANNHALDYGERAFFDTLDRMKETGIEAAGAGATLEAARSPILLQRGELTIGILAFNSILPSGFAATERRPGVNPLPARTLYEPATDLAAYPGTAARIRTFADKSALRRMREDIRRLRKRADVVIVNHHWGTSMVHDVRDFQREIAHATIAAGAHLVLGGHPHVVQGVEIHKGCPIVYSMGNLIFDFKIPFFTEATRETFLFGCRLGGRGATEPYLIPCRSGKFDAPRRLSPHRGEGLHIAEKMRALSAPLGTRLVKDAGRLRILSAGRS
ncbi:MAG: CapA family protein [bacterium]|nr:CapA family protein [bacterium]